MESIRLILILFSFFIINLSQAQEESLQKVEEIAEHGAQSSLSADAWKPFDEQHQAVETIENHTVHVAYISSLFQYYDYEAEKGTIPNQMLWSIFRQTMDCSADFVLLMGEDIDSRSLLIHILPNEDQPQGTFYYLLQSDSKYRIVWKKKYRPAYTQNIRLFEMSNGDMLLFYDQDFSEHSINRHSQTLAYRISKNKVYPAFNFVQSSEQLHRDGLYTKIISELDAFEDNNLSIRYTYQIGAFPKLVEGEQVINYIWDQEQNAFIPDYPENWTDANFAGFYPKRDACLFVYAFKQDFIHLLKHGNEQTLNYLENYLNKIKD
ncbi:MAG: hypothetical protein MK212_09185 [Saprospiraceae bacterium]|nr:hypothetical protein [Saprospiraceae bacterium]